MGSVPLGRFPSRTRVAITLSFMNVNIRAMEERDLPTASRIYNQSAVATTYSYTLVNTKVEDRLSWWHELVAEPLVDFMMMNSWPLALTTPHAIRKNNTPAMARSAISYVRNQPIEQHHADRHQAIQTFGKQAGQAERS